MCRELLKGVIHCRHRQVGAVIVISHVSEVLAMTSPRLEVLCPLTFYFIQPIDARLTSQHIHFELDMPYLSITECRYHQAQ